jgi:hypothetical protein
MEEFIIKIPATKRDIKLKDWQKFQDVLEKNKDAKDSDEFINLKALQFFCGLDLKIINNIPLSQFQEVLNHLGEVLGEKDVRVNTFKLRGTDGVEVEFGLVPNLDEMSYGEYKDLENYIYDYKTAHRAMAVLYRPVQYRKGDAYHIQRYKGSDHLSDIMKDAPLDVYLGVRVFFYNLAKKLPLYTMDYTLQQLQENVENRSDNPSEKSGVDTKQSIHLHREMLRNLMKLQP